MVYRNSSEEGSIVSGGYIYRAYSVVLCSSLLLPSLAVECKTSFCITRSKTRLETAQLGEAGINTLYEGINYTGSTI